MADKAVVKQTTLDAIGQAIIAKGGATAPMTPAQMPAAIASIPTGGGEVSSSSDVNFYLPNGTIAKSYTASEFSELTELPAQPEIDGLTAQGWNWTLEDSKAYVASYGRLNVGGTYVTDNGETRLYLTIVEPCRLEQPLRFGRSGGTGVTIDWGDGSAPVAYNHTSQTLVKHTYPGSGNYVIRMTPVDGAEILLGGYDEGNVFGDGPIMVFASRLRKIEIGTSVTSIGRGSFENCTSLSSVTIPRSVTSIGNKAFSGCSSLLSVTIPSSVTSFGNDVFNACLSLYSVTLPTSVTSIGSGSFNSCGALSSVTIPPSVTSTGMNTFTGCSALSSVTIPSSVTSMEYSFGMCNSLLSVTIPNSVTNIENAFHSCESLLSVTIPQSVTRIGDSAFENCYSLSSVTIPSSVTHIGERAFAFCSGMVKYDFTSVTSVPDLESISSFGYIPDDCKIVVPDSLYDTWISKPNWSSPTIVGHIVKASEYM